MFKAEATKLFLETFAKQNRVGVHYDQLDEPVALDNGTLHLPHPTIDTEEMWHGQTHKELSYLLPKNKFLFNAQRQYKEGSPHHLVASVIADHIAERRDFGEYSGRSKYLAENRSRLGGRIADEVATVDPTHLTPESELLRSLMQFDMQSRKDWMDSGSIKAVRDMEKCQYHGNLLKHFGDDGFPIVNDEQEFQELVESAIQILKEPPEPEMREGEGDGESEGSGDSKPSDSKKGDDDGKDGEDGQGDQSQEGQDGQEGEGDGEGEAEGSEGEGEGESKEGKGEPAVNTPTPEYNKSNGSGNDDLLNFGEGSGADGIGAEGTGQDRKNSDKINKLVQDNFKNIKLANTKCHQEAKRNMNRHYSWNGPYKPVQSRKIITGKQLDAGYANSRYNDNPDHILSEANNYPISRKLRKYLQVLQNTAYSYGLKKGKLNNARLARVLIGERQPRVYKQKQSSRLNLNTAISVLTDCSGSMRGRKEKVASIINICVHDVLKSILVPYELLGFSDGAGLNHMLFKDFEESVNRDTLAKRLCSSRKESGGNSDSDSLMWACERLMQRKEPNKVMIVLSDGQPAGSYRGDGDKQLRKTCDLIETESPINLWGVGILTNAPRNFYKDHHICSDLDQLEAIILGILKDSIVKGR